MIPPLTLRRRDGRLVRAWDFKQKQNLMIAFVDAGCEVCDGFVREVVGRAEELREKNARTLLVFGRELPEIPQGALPEEVIAGVDESGRGAEAFLGEGAVQGGTLMRRGVFVTDRYGELADLWVIEKHDFPRMEEIFGALNQVEIACEECEVPFWPVEES